MASLRKNYLYNLSAQVATLLLPLVTVPYLQRVLGSENLGIFSFAQATESYFLLFGALGLNAYGQREIASCAGDRRKESLVFYELMAVRTVTLSLSLLAYLFFALRYSAFPLYYALFALEIVASFFDISWFWQGKEEFRSHALRTVLTRLLGLMAILLFVRTEGDLWIYILCFTGSLILGNLSLWLKLKGAIERVKASELRPLKHLKPCLVMFLPQVATNVYTQLDKTMIGLLTGRDYAEVNYYSQAEKLVKIVMTAATAMGGIMLSRVAAAFSRGDEEQVRGDLHRSFRFLFLIGWPLTLGLMAIAPNFVPWFFHGVYPRITVCLMALSPLILIIGLSNILGIQYLTPTRQMGAYTASILSGMGINVCCNALLIPRWGAYGAVAATLLAECAVTGVQFRVTRGVFHPRVILEGWKNALAAVLMGTGVWCLNGLLPALPWATAAEILWGGALYFLLLLLLRDRFFLEGAREILGKLRHRGK